ncbi:MAG: hypothetical protein ACK4IY_00480 [Chitinophagales bacterium]
MYLLFSISVITAADVFTQTPEFAAVGTRWWYEYIQFGFDPGSPPYTLSVEKDTLF